MPPKLYDEVKKEIPDHVGVYCDGECVKRAKKQVLAVGDQVLKDSLIRCIYRDVDKLRKSRSLADIDKLKRQIAAEKRKADEYYRKYWDLMQIGREKYGPRWYKEEPEACQR